MTQTIIDHPPYYQGCVELTRPILLQMIPANLLDLECIEAIERLNLSFGAGSILKYLWRAGEKDNLLADLRKAQWYMQRCRNQRRLTGLGQLGKAARMLNELIKEQPK